ncbi:MAG: phosphotransferase [Bacteroidota bacterium]|nr:phosphotransferase [Bacteroidota bacterium]
MLDSGYWMLDWMLDSGCWILDTGCWILDAGYWILDGLDF